MYKLNQNETPLFNALMEYVNRDTIPFHVPGHKKGNGIDKEFKNFIGENPFKIDVTVFKLVDSLHHPTGPIKKAQELAADAYGSKAAFYSVNGTSGAIQGMILSVVGDGDKIIVPRNVHKSVTAGIILSGAVPVYMHPEVDRRVGIAHGVSPETVGETLKNNPDAKAVLLINPTYYGVSTDIKKIADIVHSYDIPLIVDEAHGPHLSFNDRLPVSALKAGADMCAQSTHKIIGALTQMSLLHVNSDRIDMNRVQQIMNLLQTTSPSYILMASMDCARRQIALHGKELLDGTIDLCNYARREINKIPGFYCFGEEVLGKPGSYAFDPTKLTITCTDLGITGYDLDMLLANDYHIQVELSDLYNVLAVGSFGDTKENIDALINALRQISKSISSTVKNKKNSFIDIPDVPERILSPRDAFNGAKESMLIKDSVGKTSGEFLMAYPPGIPVLCPGEIITQEIIDYVSDLKAAGLYVQGTEDPDVNYIKVLK
ncbi:lysine decarboxylase [Clostridium acetobutylicum]|uniref:Lysine decarboxylase n=1 Tax=Clostridium acetobutylicum (strain ATCC 824 / DSM 792 / JCM 1419 / IAM 19013 / LMG 5710 / NBRC 13948 / NRRL B-527 / VKM B-1787 / 2291 / W) TaxID=272562 RepID=Q97GM8_CLOAB|nr:MULTISPECIES: aminotransferase class I/II-fold pyridoxal phosphate-dependent enzyme [Clostridium]AAK80294.1 Lysine decarboxylase [Clostridium acetobutylicum ATCC 824]AEI33618.1 lysine decarboxylase [Clostridium acetobutylicum DSM 1731]AWV79284.1 aminotransferase class I/II-fold pyridoxal phosphate-dependent enzyme [Clostridium acetobutylicum]MBC2394746.1 aminotransferase class I/II-fold pyridoxal phosphate-dependent enzyme [Clostridium acetobutylicum]MBC2585705.1 aminotransferase class I/II